MTQPIVYQETREEIFLRIVMAILVVNLVILMICYAGCHLIEFKARMQQRYRGTRIRIFHMPEQDDDQ